MTRWPLLRHPLAIGLGFIVMFWMVRLLSVIYPVFLLTFLSILVATIFSYPVNFFSRFMPQSLAVVLTLILFLGLLAGVGFLAIPFFAAQAAQLLKQVPAAMGRIHSWFYRATHAGVVANLTKGAQGQQITSSLQTRVSQGLQSVISKMIPAAFGIVELLSGALITVVLAAFFSYSPKSYRLGVRALVPKKHEAELDELWHRLGLGLTHWVSGILIGMTIMGSITAAGLWIAGIDGWPILAILTFLGTFIPYVGAIGSAIPGLLLGLAKDPTHFLYAGIVYIGVHVTEGYIVQPLIMRKAVELRPGLLLIWQLLMGALFGILGIIVATPLLVCVNITVGYLYVERRLGKPADELNRTEEAPPSRAA